jgi:transmembrane sensor
MMNDNKIHITGPEEEALQMMENASHITSEQLESLKNEDECMQLCCDVAEITMYMQRERDALKLDIAKELSDFHRKRSSRKTKRMKWVAVSLGVAASVAGLLVLRLFFSSPVPDKIEVFLADHSASTQVTLQIAGEKEIEPVMAAVKKISAPAELSSGEISYLVHKEQRKEVEQKRVEIHKLTIPRGGTFKVILSDGSEVYLNADTRFTYPTVFNGKERVVWLNGEAYFKVARNTECPFIVKSGRIDIRVLGTEFDVCNYPSTDARVTLIEGKVAVRDTCGGKTIEMNPKQSIQYFSDGTYRLTEVDTEAYLYWKEGFFYFDDVTLADMMKEIGRWYNIDIEFRNASIMGLRMHFSTNRNREIDHIVDLLNRMEKIHAYFESGRLIIE